MLPPCAGSRQPPELVIEPGPLSSARRVAWSTGAPEALGPVTSWETPSLLRPVKVVAQPPLPERVVVNEQIALDSVGDSNRPFTVTV